MKPSEERVFAARYGTVVPVNDCLQHACLAGLKISCDVIHYTVDVHVDVHYSYNNTTVTVYVRTSLHSYDIIHHPYIESLPTQSLTLMQALTDLVNPIN